VVYVYKVGITSAFELGVIPLSSVLFWARLRSVSRSFIFGEGSEIGFRGFRKIYRFTMSRSCLG